MTIGGSERHRIRQVDRRVDEPMTSSVDTLGVRRCGSCRRRGVDNKLAAAAAAAAVAAAIK